MDDYFCLKCKDGDGKFHCVENPNCENGVEVTVNEVQHGGDNQLWKYDGEQIISQMLSPPSYSLSVNEIKNNSPVILSCVADNTDEDVYYNKWTFKDGVIKLKADENFSIGLSNKKIVLQNLDENGVTEWETEICESSAKPATSCHLHYEPIPRIDQFDSWALENTVCVRKSENCTYFCILGWGPGGYSGIQQISEHHKVAIFSMWNNGRHGVRLIESGEGVKVTRFGGEGTGMKAMKDIHWENDQKVSFKVTGNKYYDEEEANTVWKCSGWYSIEGSDWHLMASYERSGDPPFNRNFYSFVEDWNRSWGAEGNILMRCAEFSNPKLMLPNRQPINFDKAVFTKQTQGADRFGMEKAFGGIKKSPPSFVLSTGGSSVSSVEQYLHMEKYEQCTNKYGEELSL